MQCSICFDEIDVSATGQVTLACGHQNHLSCISQWFAQNGSCPLCRKEAEGLGSLWKEEKPESEINSYSTYIYTFGSTRAQEEEEEEWEEEEAEITTADIIKELMERRLSFNSTEFLQLYWDSISYGYGNRYSMQKWLSAWDVMVANEMYEKAPPTFPGDLRFFLTYNDVRGMVLVQEGEKFSDIAWRMLCYAKDRPETGAFSSAERDFKTPIKLPSV